MPNKPRTAPNSNKKWTCRNAELEILEILHQAGFYPTDYIRHRISNVLDRVAEYHVFEGQGMNIPAEKQEYTKTTLIDGEKHHSKYTIQ